MGSCNIGKGKLMGKENNLEVYKQIRTDLEARIIYENFDGECHRVDYNENGGFFPIVIVSMPDDSGAWYEDEDGDEKFISLGLIRLNEEKYKEMLEIKQQKGW